MPIPGPSTVGDSTPHATRSPFYLRLNGVWLPTDGVVPSSAVTSERPRSSITSMNGNRFEQRAPVARRSWSWSLPWASLETVSAIAAAVESDEDVWLMSDAVASANMLPPRSCFGSVGTAVDCGGIPLRGWATSPAPPVLSGRVRGGVPTTLSCWSNVAAPAAVLAATYPGGSATVASAGSGQVSTTFTPTADGPISITPAANTSGLMLTEDAAPPMWLPGESMPCKVVIDDPGDTLLMRLDGVWRHDFSVTLREVG